MGCTSTKHPKINIEQIYKDLMLPPLDQNDYENDFEKQAFMTINVFRHDPKVLLESLKEVKGKYSKDLG